MAEKVWRGTRFAILATELVLISAWAGCAVYSRTSQAEGVTETAIGLKADRDVLDLFRRTDVQEIRIVPATTARDESDE